MTVPFLKQCSSPTCRTWMPGTPEFFHRSRRDADGLDCYCKECRYQRIKMYKQRRRENALVQPRVLQETLGRRIMIAMLEKPRWGERAIPDARLAEILGD